MYKILAATTALVLIAGCSSGVIEQKEYKNRLDYCKKIEMSVQIEKNEKSNPTKIECIDEHGSVFDSKTGY